MVWLDTIIQDADGDAFAGVSTTPGLLYVHIEAAMCALVLFDHKQYGDILTSGNGA